MPRSRAKHPLADPARPGLERLAGLAGTVMKAPIATVILSEGGDVRELAALRRHVEQSGEPLRVGDAREHELTNGMAVVKSGKLLAYLGVPLVLDGAVVGVLSVADARPRVWKRADVGILESLACSAVTELELARLRTRASEPADWERTPLSPDPGQLSSAKALLRRLETAVDAAQSALSTTAR
jgi:GAF domain-containing protein